MRIEFGRLIGAAESVFVFMEEDEEGEDIFVTFSQYGSDTILRLILFLPVQSIQEPFTDIYINR